MASFWPALLWFLGWRLSQGSGTGGFAAALGSGVKFVAMVCLTLEFTRRMIRRDGLGEIHFGWPRPLLSAIHKRLAGFLVVALPAVLVIVVMEKQTEAAWNETVGRAAFLVLMAALAVFLLLVVRSIERGKVPDQPERVVRRGRLRIWYVLALGAPVTSGAVAIMGYYYAALQLSLKFHGSVCLFIVVLVFQGMVLRGLLLTQRRLALAEYQRRRKALAKKASGEAGAEGEQPEEELDLAKVHVQSSCLLRGVILFTLIIGIWVIWVDVVTTLGLLKRVELWQITQEVSQTITDAEGNTRVETREQFKPVTLADLVLALLILAMTGMVMRNAPGLLQVVLLDRFKLGTGERHAASKIAQYAIVVIGGAVAFRTVGISWGNVQ
jgi:potassium efflux system protein